jgi:hypothetical protein
MQWLLGVLWIQNVVHATIKPREFGQQRYQYLGTMKLDHWELDIWKQSPQPHHHQSPTATCLLRIKVELEANHRAPNWLHAKSQKSICWKKTVEDRMVWSPLVELWKSPIVIKVPMHLTWFTKHVQLGGPRVSSNNTSSIFTNSTIRQQKYGGIVQRS